MGLVIGKEGEDEYVERGRMCARVYFLSTSLGPLSCCHYEKNITVKKKGYGYEHGSGKDEMTKLLMRLCMHA